MQLAFILLTAAGLLYFIFGKRHFDYFSVAFLSACAYFIPGVFGVVQYPSANGFTEVGLVKETYVVMLVVLGAILVAGIISEFFPKQPVKAMLWTGSGYSAQIAVITAIIGTFLAILTIGDAFLSVKSEMLSNLNRWYILATVSGTLGAVLSFERRLWVYFALSMLVLLAALFIGSRTEFALTVISLFTLSLTKAGKPQRLVFKKFGVGLLVIAVILFLFVAKGLYGLMKAGLIPLVVDNLSTKQFYQTSLLYSEPFITQAILNEVMRSDFFVGMGHFSGVLYQLVPFSPELGAEVVSFNDLFQPALFPDTEWMGMANNIWAEMLSSGGWQLLVLFVVVYILGLILGSLLLRSSHPDVRAGSALLFSYWAFYFHRNDLLFQINLEKRILVLLILFVLASRCVELIKSSLKNEHWGTIS